MTRNWYRTQTPQASGCALSASGKDVDLSGHDEIAFRQSLGGMGPQRDLDLTPGQHDVGMMSLLLRDLAHAVHKSERLLEIRKGKAAQQVMLFHRFPLRNLAPQLFNGRPAKRRHTTAAGNAVLFR